MNLACRMAILLVLSAGFALQSRAEPSVRIEVRPPDEPGEVRAEAMPTAAALPREMTICRGPHECWSEAGQSRCDSRGEGSGRPYRILRVDESDLLPRALKDCWHSVGGQ
ncbi:MAG: hypothetical protein KatS3mg077_2695 [Candidatus Binatia bacterium]|nr:MAG: hypothetical protein KatS3mg077_2695 [Candidatus Binatia bacterium]